MKRSIPILAIVIITIPLTILAFTADDPIVAVDSGPAATNLGPQPATPTSALALTIENIQQEARGRVLELSLKLTDSAQGSTEAEGLQRQIAQVKAEAEIAILDAVIEDARVSGDEVRRIEAETARDRLVDPDQYSTPSIPTARPAPSN